MKPLRSSMMMVTFFGLMAILQACGDSQDKLRTEAEQQQKSAAKLESDLGQARDALARQQDENNRLAGQLDSLREKVKELEAAAAKKTEATRPEIQEVPDAGRIGLMGAKAIAEFKAEQLSKRLDTLSANLDKKEQELAKINQLAKQKDAEVAKLRETIEKLQSQDESRVGELQARVDKISKELEKRSAEANKFEQDLQEKSELLAALKSAVNDASKLKSATEAENAKLQTELAQLSKQLETTKTQAAQDHQDLQDCAAWAEKAAKEIEQQRTAMDQYRAESDRLRAEGDQLKAALADLNNRIRAAESTEGRESAIERILEAPKAGASAGGPSSSLY